MTINDYVKSASIILNLKKNTKKEVIEELVEFAIIEKKIKKEIKNDLLKKIFNREEKGSTGLQNGIAIPHAKTDLVNEFIFVFGFHKKGVAFDSIDNKPVNFLILTISPVSESSKHLEFLSYICHKLKDSQFQKKILNQQNAKEIKSFLIN